MLYPMIRSERFIDPCFIDSLLDDMLRPAKKFAALSSSAGMKTDIRERDDAYDLHIELPGYEKEDLKAQLKDGYLTIIANARKDNDEADEKGRFIRRERYYGASCRSFCVGDDVTEEDIKAKYENGILTVTVPKKEPKAEEAETSGYIEIE